MPASQLTTHERYQITYLHMNGHSPAEIGRRLGRHRATIGRELPRNADPLGGYHYLSAQAQADTRRSFASRRYKLDTPGSVAGKAVREGLKQRWSPEQIAGRLRLDHPDDNAVWVSHETIYPGSTASRCGARPFTNACVDPAGIGVAESPATARPSVGRSPAESASKSVPRVIGNRTRSRGQAADAGDPRRVHPRVPVHPRGSADQRGEGASGAGEADRSARGA